MNMNKFILEENALLRSELQKEKEQSEFYKDILIKYFNALVIIKENSSELSTTINFQALSFNNKIELDKYIELVEQRIKEFI